MQLRRGDVAVFSVSAALAAIVVLAVGFSLFVVDREPDSSANEAGPSTSTLLVVTWGPSLCKVDPSNPGCESGHVGALGPTLILHGLWPQPRTEQFCDVPKSVADRARNLKSTDMPSLDLPRDVQTSLQSIMSDASVLAPHEWYAHGTCSGVAPAVYFRDAVTLTDQVGELLNPLFAKAENGRVSLGAVRDRFDAEFGAAAGDRVALTCSDVDGEGIVVYEVHLSLPPVVEFRSGNSAVSLGDLLVRGPTISAECRRGRVP